MTPGVKNLGSITVLNGEKDELEARTQTVQTQ